MCGCSFRQSRVGDILSIKELINRWMRSLDVKIFAMASLILMRSMALPMASSTVVLDFQFVKWLYTQIGPANEAKAWFDKRFHNHIQTLFRAQSYQVLRAMFFALI